MFFSVSVYGLVKHDSQARNLVYALREAGLPPGAIAVLFPDRERANRFKQTQDPERLSASDGALGWTAGISVLAIPGIGPFDPTGSPTQAAEQATVGVAVEGVAASLTGLGVPEFEARIYEGKVRSGHILVSADVPDMNEVRRIRAIMKQSGAEDVTCPGEARTPVRQHHPV